MYIPQYQLKNIPQFLMPGKVLVLYGARRVGKTTLIHHIVANSAELINIPQKDILVVSGDDIYVRDFLESQSIQKLQDFIGNHSLLIIDEAQYIKKIGLNLKLIVDHIPDINVIATGSSSFDLSRDIGEPLTGRKYVLKLYPLAQLELAATEKQPQTKALLESRLIYGSYPEIVTMRDNKMREEYLRELISSYLFKDILELEGIRQSEKLIRLLQLLAFQIGNEVSLSELGSQLGMSKNTVERYLDLLEKVFVIYKRSGFSRNLRKEISKNHRYYFYDTGIRNSLIQNMNPLSVRDDVGKLWENYIVTERMKRQEYLRQQTDFYFWRTYDRKEIDLIEERAGALHGYEMKWKPSQVKPPKEWKTEYTNSTFEVIHPENYLGFIT